MANSNDFLSLKDYFYAFVSALAGVVIGVLWTEWKWKRERRIETQLLRANLVKAFRFALGGVQQCLDYLQKPPAIIPNFRLDTSTIGHILFTGRGLFHDEAMFDRFNWQRYQLDHINAKLDYMHVYLSSAASIDSGLAQNGYSSLVAHLKTSQKEISELIAEYERSA